MIAQEQVSELIGSTAYDRSGSKLGKVGQVYLDGRTGDPEWITAKTGLFGTQVSFVPIRNAKFEDGSVTVDHSKDTVKDAPRVESDSELSGRDENALYQHYGLAEPTRQEPEHGDRAGPSNEDAMTRSEEQLRVGTERHEAGHARLRKYVVTENQQVNVPVSHEEAYIEREPISETNREQAMEGDTLSEDEHEVTLHEERPTVSKEAHPVERVRMEKETVRDEETVSDQVRKERIESEGTENTPGNS